MGSMMLDSPGLASPKAKNLIMHSMTRVKTIQRAFISTGLDVCLNEGVSFFDGRSPQLLFEAVVAAKEIQWRLQDVARDLSLQAGALDSNENEGLQALVAMLDGQQAEQLLAL
jgi:hypothetical protein